MYRAPRVINKYLDLYEHQKSYAYHTRKLETMKPTIDTSTPKEAGRFVLYRERRKKEMEMQLEIDRICQESVTIRESQRSAKLSFSKKDSSNVTTFADGDGFTVIDQKTPRTARLTQKPTITRPIIRKIQSPRTGQRPGVFSPVRQPSPRTNGAPRRKQGNQIIPPTKYAPPAISVEGGEFAFQAEVDSKPEQEYIDEETLSAELNKETEITNQEQNKPQLLQISHAEECENYSLNRPIVDPLSGKTENIEVSGDNKEEKLVEQKENDSDFSDSFEDDDNDNSNGENKLQKENISNTEELIQSTTNIGENVINEENQKREIGSESDFESDENNYSDKENEYEKKEDEKSESDHFNDDSDDFNSNPSNKDNVIGSQSSAKVEDTNICNDFGESKAHEQEEKEDNDDDWDSEPNEDRQANEEPSIDIGANGEDEQKINPSLSSFTGDILGKFIAEDGEANDDDFDLDSLLPSKRGGIDDFELE